MTQQAPDPDELEEGSDDYFCPSVPGVGPHKYQPATDILGSGIYLFCEQCGETMHIDGTGLPPGSLPQPGSAPPTQTSISGVTPKPFGLP